MRVLSLADGFAMVFLFYGFLLVSPFRWHSVPDWRKPLDDLLIWNIGVLECRCSKLLPGYPHLSSIFSLYATG